jgi:uncharacterized protein DUF6445
MIPALHPRLRIEKRTIGAERAPLLVIDALVSEPEALVEDAASRSFDEPARYYPGIRTPAPESYQDLILTQLREALLDCLGVQQGTLRFSMCQYSIVTTPPEQLTPPQRIPHVDSLSKYGLATIHYLFKAPLGGTAFYRHRRTGFEYVDESRNADYVQCLQLEHMGREAPPAAYINGDTPLFEQIAKAEAVFNRMLVYRRNSLHSGCIDTSFVPDVNPRTGRLSINSFIDVLVSPQRPCYRNL